MFGFKLHSENKPPEENLKKRQAEEAAKMRQQFAEYHNDIENIKKDRPHVNDNQAGQEPVDLVG